MPPRADYAAAEDPEESTFISTGDTTTAEVKPTI